MVKVKPHDLDDQHGHTIVATITVQLRRDGAVGVSGSITDEMSARYMLETAMDTVRGYHARRRLGQGCDILVPAHDTAIVGTEEEKLLLKARDELVNARDLVERNG